MLKEERKQMMSCECVTDEEGETMFEGENGRVDRYWGGKREEDSRASLESSRKGCWADRSVRERENEGERDREGQSGWRTR